jgi:hypothetical protein
MRQIGITLFLNQDKINKINIEDAFRLMLMLGVASSTRESGIQYPQEMQVPLSSSKPSMELGVFTFCALRILLGTDDPKKVSGLHPRLGH